MSQIISSLGTTRQPTATFSAFWPLVKDGTTTTTPFRESLKFKSKCGRTHELFSQLGLQNWRVRQLLLQLFTHFHRRLRMAG